MYTGGHTQNAAMLGAAGMGVGTAAAVAAAAGMGMMSPATHIYQPQPIVGGVGHVSQMAALAHSTSKSTFFS